MTAFSLVWAGQLVSMFGSAMTQFALTLFVYQETQAATALALMGVFTFLPLVLASPVAGALVDRWNRKLVMMLSDLASGAASIAILVLSSLGSLEVWHLYVTGFIIGTFQAFQFPAYSAAISTMVPKDHYGRAAGMMSLAGSASGIAAPVLAAGVLALGGLNAVLLIDVASFLVAIAALAVVRVPQPPVSAEGARARGSLWSESVFGFRYILERPPLLALQLVFLCINLTATFGFTVMAAMVLSRTGQDSLQFGAVQSAAGLGGVLGAVLLTAWGGPRRKVYGVLGGMAAAGLLGLLPLGTGRVLPVWMFGAFANALIVPVLNGCNQAIWQAKVPPDIQGKVFSARRMIAWLANPLAMLLAGPAADLLFTPALMPGGSLASSLGPLVGVGAGAGMGLMLALAGLAQGAVALTAWLSPTVREADRLVPDHDAALPPAPAGTGAVAAAS
ncbi:MAG TPA: MFS transporter [Deinococcales bacterium]|nr:MFS transporter [Deinococcales bacterium]